MSNHGTATERRIYTAEEIEACLFFVKLPTPTKSQSSATSTSNNITPIVEWWPCLVFENMLELNAVTEQLEMWSTLPKGQIMMTYMQQLPASATCRVALLLGQPPPNNSVIQFDFTRSEINPTCISFVVEPFYQKVLQFGALYATNEQYLNAIQKTIPLLQNVADSLRKSSADENSIRTINTNDVVLQPAARNESQPSTETNSSSSANREKCDRKGSSSGNHIIEHVSHTTNNEKRKDVGVSDTSRTGNLSTDKSKPNKKETLYKSKIPNKNVVFVEIPVFQDVKKILIKGGYTFQKNFFCRPSITDNGEVILPPQRFKTIEALRHDLCVYGVNCRCGTSTDEEKACQCWDVDDKWNIKLWVRYDVIRGPIQVSSPVQVIPSIYNATQYLLRLEYNRRQLESPLTTDEQRHELFRYLSRYGLPSENGESPLSCDYSKISPEERFSLEYFISSNRFRVNTFTYHPPNTAEQAPILAIEADSPILSSAVRPKRTIIQRERLDETNLKKPKLTLGTSGGATIVSIESTATIDTNSSLGSSSSKLSSKRNRDESLKKEKSIKVRSPPKRSTIKEKTGIVSYHSPIPCDTDATRIQEPSTKKIVQQQRVSLSPMAPDISYTKPPIPIFDGSDQEKLNLCLDALKTDHRSNTPTICYSKEKSMQQSQFATNMRKVSTFVHGVLLSCGQNGDGSGTSEGSAALYVCGSPGLGKTSGVHWCCNHVAASSSSSDVQMKVCHINAAYLTSQSTPLTLVMEEIGKCMAIKSEHPSESTIIKALRHKSVVVLIVIDEIDAFVNSNGRTTGGTNCLQKLLQWANNPKLRFGLIGISNCMNDDNMSEIGALGTFMDSIIFSPYSEFELQQILLARVGSTVIAPNVIDYISKKVASSTGDARKALEMAAYAVQHRIDQLTSSNAAELTDGPLVKMPNVIQGNKEEVLNLKERIAGQPVVGKVILCVLTSYAQASGAVDTTIGELKQCVSECMRQTGIEDEMVQMEDFLVLLETLVDSGLLRASSTESYNKRNGMNLSRRTLSDVHRQPIRLGIQLEDIEKVLESELKQSFYQNLRVRAKARRQDEQ